MLTGLQYSDMRWQNVLGSSCTLLCLLLSLPNTYHMGVDGGDGPEGSARRGSVSFVSRVMVGNGLAIGCRSGQWEMILRPWPSSVDEK